ncbi:MAG TPA: hypothetical protein H9889_05035 [Candidatus Ignatzschineria merdigallinarum]|uniref:Uncharacterized protein n=1 Tax=Candidatus Ignatzschineria merdigallinarum TaxID=2838621 RepID=A0A9D1Q6T1_9GAMM|nr:hypothetical protein [Candidatus Ignatzschineria merdigallinarum]
MKKKMIYLLLIIIGLGCLSLAIGFHEFQKDKSIGIHKNLTAQAQIAPQTMSQFLRGNF